ncbi:MAG: AMP-binding protein [Rhizobium sp.]|nr:AMP-binding protein [Rhizobium sp.]
MQPEFLSAVAERGAVGLETDDPVIYRALVTPDRQAVYEVTTGRTETYATLDDAVARAAYRLGALVGTLPQSQRVAFLGRNSVDQIIVCLACQRAGLVFVPLNWRLGAAELGQIIADCEPALLLHDAEFGAVLADVAQAMPPTIAIEGEGGWAESVDAAPRAEPAKIGAEAPCIMLYTSGTTGSPKGVIITRRNAFASAINFSLVGEVTSRSVALCDLPFFHTIGLVAIGRTTLMMGGRLVISDRFLPDRTLSVLGDPALGITHYFAVPQMAAALRNTPAWNPSALKALQAIFIGGAPLSPALIETFLQDGIPLVNGYGMSEAGTSIHMPLDRDAVARHHGSVGFPAPLLAVRLVGDDGQDVPDGEVGEIWVKGPSVTPGYWNKPGETARAFVGEWYRTGDLGRRAEGGVIHVPDRLKDMYISGGENVFPAEIEAVIGAHPKVRDVAVLGLPDPKWGECGVAFIVAQDEPPSADEILAHCAERLASYKRPARIVFIEQIPRTASGKAQKHILRQTHASR